MNTEGLDCISPCPTFFVSGLGAPTRPDFLSKQIIIVLRSVFIVMSFSVRVIFCKENGKTKRCFSIFQDFLSFSVNIVAD